MTSNLHTEVVALLEQVSREIILPRFQNLKASEIEEKSPGDLVTIADKLSEERLSEGLRKFLPEAAIIGEEACAEDPSLLQHLSDDIVWIIDPIDGTGNFAAGKPPFGIIIALAEADETIAGWMYDPIRKRICHSYKGQGSFVNGDRVFTNSKHQGKPKAALATGFMTEEQRAKTIAQSEPNYKILPIPRCCAEQYPLLVSGDHHVTIFERTLAWDHAAGILFLNEAGGKACRWDGSPYRPSNDTTGLLGASSPELWEEARQIFDR
ncbi:MAG: inositol monophosphatase family protein [Parasphingorhabdus sp.]